MIGINSPSCDEKKMAEALKAKLIEIGCEVYEDNAAESIVGTTGNVIGKFRGTIGKTLLLSAHMDRVPNGDNIKHLICYGKIKSDGKSILAADDVSGIVSILDGLRRVKESGKEHCEVEVVFTACEEMLLKGSKYLDYSRITARHAYCLDSPGHIGRIINSAPYEVQFNIEVFGKTAHAGNEPERGVNALKAAAQILADMDDGRIDFETTANWALISAGKVTNIVCDHVEIVGEARSRNYSKLYNYICYVKRHCEEVIIKPAATHSITVEHCFDGFNIPPEDELLSTLKDILNNMNIDVVVEGGGGGLDANRYNEKGIKCIGVATGYFKNHSVDEEIYIEDLKQSGKMVENLIMVYSKK